MQVRSDTAGMISKGAGDKVQKHLPVMGVMRHRSKRDVLYAMIHEEFAPPSAVSSKSAGMDAGAVSGSEKEVVEKREMIESIDVTDVLRGRWFVSCLARFLSGRQWELLDRMSFAFSLLYVPWCVSHKTSRARATIGKRRG